MTLKFNKKRRSHFKYVWVKDRAKQCKIEREDSRSSSLNSQHIPSKEEE
jgi:hypothetical protein